MAIIPQKKAMQFHRKNLRLLTGLAVLVCAVIGLICGCGSNEVTPASRQGEKKPALALDAGPLVKEILPDGRVVTAVPPERLAGRMDPGATEVAPPNVPGGRGVTLAEVLAAAAAAKPVDPDLVEVVPPDKPGSRSLTAAEVKARADAAKPVDPDLVEVVPPDKPGGRSLTAMEVKAVAAALEQPVDPDSLEVVPPDKPGGRGLTVGEVKAVAAAAPPLDPESFEVVPPDRPTPQQGGMTNAAGRSKNKVLK